MWWLDSRWPELVTHMIASYGFLREHTWAPGLIVNWFRPAPGLAGHWAMDHLDSIQISIYRWFTMQILSEYYDYYQDYYRNSPKTYKSEGNTSTSIRESSLHHTPPYPKFQIVWDLCHQSNNQSKAPKEMFLELTSDMWPTSVLCDPEWESETS